METKVVPWENRRCRICGRKLSIHNNEDECFHHSYAIDHNPHRYVKEARFTNTGRYFAIVDYYGKYVNE